jgi:acylphosphatase
MEVVRVKARLHAKVFGDVQGVFFRAHTEEKARELGVAGWVRNLSGGGVEVLAEGDKELLEQLLAWLGKGPPSAHVEKVESEWEKFAGEFSGFTVRR